VELRLPATAAARVPAVILLHSSGGANTRTYIDDAEVVARPIRLFHGTADDVAPLGQCLSYVKRLQAAGRDAQLTEYAGAYHGFDNPLTPVRAAGPPTTRRGCDLYEQSVGRVLNRETGVLSRETTSV
jgi:dienelactone hydrolase